MCLFGQNLESRGPLVDVDLRNCEVESGDRRVNIIYFADLSW